MDIESLKGPKPTKERLSSSSSSEEMATKYATIHFDLPSSSNQDRGRMWEVEDVSFYLVCDGHGQSGQIFADYAVEFLYETLTKIDVSVDDLTEPIMEMINNLETSSREKFSSIGGGTTLSLCICRENDNWIVNLGDSEIVLFDKSNNQYEILSEDHSPHNISEFKRIREFHEDVVFEYDKRRYAPGSYALYEQLNGKWVKKAPPKENVYVKNLESQYAVYFGNGRNHKLTTTRSIGDFNYKDKYGALAEPYIRKISKLTEDQSIIVASDGFWDCWKYTCIMEVIANNDETLFESMQKERAQKYFGSSKDDTYFFYIPARRWKIKMKSNR